MSSNIVPIVPSSGISEGTSLGAHLVIRGASARGLADAPSLVVRLYDTVNTVRVHRVTSQSHIVYLIAEK